MDSADRVDLETIKLLIEKEKVYIHSRGEYSYTPLQKAAYRGHLEVCKYLILKGANINSEHQSQKPYTTLICPKIGSLQRQTRRKNLI